MIIKKFEATTAPRTLELVKKALGENAVIFSQKTLDKGTPQQRVEIMAAMDYDMDATPAPLMPEKEMQGKPLPTYGYEAIRKPQKARPRKQSTQLANQELAKNFAKLLEEKTEPWQAKKRASARPPCPRPSSASKSKNGAMNSSTKSRLSIS